VREWPYILLGYYLLTRGDVMTTLDSAQLRWPVLVLDEDRLGVSGRAGAAITNPYAPPVHNGVDIAIAGHYTDAKALVLAMAAGTVVRAVRGSRGWLVVLDHGDWISSYLHLADVDTRTGAAVLAGQRLGRMGADPLDRERIVHLHLQIAPNGHTVDPEPYLRKAV
jgi:murein DD-endopeptidase MepM/ murein hydrolase activator NlpD